MISGDDLNKWRFSAYVNAFYYVYNVKSVRTVVVIS